MDDLPPKKDLHFSIRNVRHKKYKGFLALRNKAIEAMAGRAWYDGPVEMEFTLYAPASSMDDGLTMYAAGIEDTLDGSHGPTFTYLPVVYQDDCQISSMRLRYVESSESRYKLRIPFR